VEKSVDSLIAVRRTGLALASVLVVLLCACGSSTAARPSPSPRSAALCFSAPPADWSAALSKPAVTLPGVKFLPMAIDGVRHVVYGPFYTAQQQGIAGVDLETGTMSTIAIMSAEASGVAWMDYADPWLVWAQGESQYTLGNWTIQAWSRLSQEQVELASSRLPDGTYLENELAFPVVGHGYVGWNQPTNRSSVDLRLYVLGSHQSTTLDSGTLSSPVFAGHYLVWAKITGQQSDATFHFVDAETLKPVPAPAELSGPYRVSYLAGSPDYLLWIAGASTASQGKMVVDDLATGRLTTYASDDTHYLQFPVLAGHFLVWYGPAGNSIADLRTGAAIDISQNGSVAADSDDIVVGTLAAGVKGAITSTTISVLHPSTLSGLGSCQA
jgi:hypothetical protein